MKFGKRMTALLAAISIGVSSVGCSRQSLSLPETGSTVGTKDDTEKQKENVLEAEQEPLSKEKTGEETGVGPLELIPADLEFSVAKAEASIGSFSIAMPSGWKIEQRISEEGIKQYVLTDIHSACADEETNFHRTEGHRDGYEHEIIITPYVISRMPEQTLQLAAEMKRYFPVPILGGIKGAVKTQEIEGCWMHGKNRDAGEEEYFIFSESETGQKELFHVMEGDSSVTSYQNDVESFQDFLKEGFVHGNSGKCVIKQEYTSELEYYYWLNDKTDDPLFLVVRDGTDEMAVYRSGDYQTPLSIQRAQEEYPGGKYLLIADFNQDGYDDILCNYWELNPQYNSETEGYLWDEKSASFEYTLGESLLGNVVWEDWGWKESLTGSQQIPKELIAYLSDPLLGSKEELKNLMLPMVNDKELTIEEVKELARENPDIKRQLLTITCNSLGQGIWLKADADNDGIEDIFLCEYLGGSLGAVSYYLFKGTKEGRYIFTSKEEELKMEFAFINWEGKNYLAKTTWEFTKKCVDGIQLECYADGRYQGGVELKITAKEGMEGRSIKTSYLEKEKYSNLASSLYTLAGTYQSGTRLSCGTGEEEMKDEEYNRCSDIDNDGVLEKYRISLWQTTNYYTVDSLSYDFEEAKLNDQIRDMIYENGIIGTPINLWVDETDFGNVIYVLYEDGLYDFHICGYMLTETEYRKLLQVDCYVKTLVTCQNINRIYELGAYNY